MESRNYKLYLHIAPNEKRYYGITSQKVEKRWLNGKGYSHNEHFSNAIKKYGWSNFKHEILFENLTKEEAELLEQMYILLYNTTNRKYGYNKTYGGEMYIPTEETVNKISEKNKGKKRSKEWKNKQSESHKGKKHTEESKNKISESNKGHDVSYETREKISTKLKGIKRQPFTEEHKLKISESNKGKKGKKGLESHISKIYILIFEDREPILKTATQLYNYKNTTGFFEIGEKAFKKYVLPLGGVFIDEIKNMISNNSRISNNSYMKDIISKLKKYDGCIIRLATEEEINILK